MTPDNNPVIDPNVPIVDSHLHLWDRAAWRYVEDDFLNDVRTGHNIVATVFVECRSHYLDTGPEEQRSLGETLYAADIASRYAGKTPHLCAGIVGNVDLRLGDQVERLLELHLERGAGYFRGIRQIAAFDSDPEVAATTIIHPPPGLLSDDRFRDGFRRLQKFGLSFDTWIYHTQLSELYDLARAFPSTTVVLDHAAWPIGVGPYAARKADVFAEWRRAIRQVAGLPNVFVKLGGLGMPVVDLRPADFSDRPSHENLALAWRRYLEWVIDSFGVDRCMFESNFPVDKLRVTYRAAWNAFQFFAAGYSRDERYALFHGVAQNVYRLRFDQGESEPDLIGLKHS